MIYLFEIPQIIDTIQQLKNNLVFSYQFNFIKNLAFLSEVQDLRVFFKKIVNESSIERIQYGESMVQYQQKLESYLKTNVDMMCILATQPTFIASFEYKTFLSKNIKQYKTSESNEEACACEIVFARYGYAFLYFLDAFQHIKYIRDKIQPTFYAEKLSCEQYLKEINNALEKFKIGIEPLQKLYKVMPEVLKSLIKKKKDLIPETKGEVICAIKLTLEVNSHSLELEKLRIENNYQQMTQIAKTCVMKLKQAEIDLLPEKELIQRDLIEFCKFGQYYFKLYTLWALMKSNVYDIKIENYAKKNYILLSFENLAIAKYLLAQKDRLDKISIQDDYIYFCKNYFNSAFILDAQEFFYYLLQQYNKRILKIGQYIQQSDKYQEPSADKVFEDIQLQDAQQSFIF